MTDWISVDEGMPEKAGLYLVWRVSYVVERKESSHKEEMRVEDTERDNLYESGTYTGPRFWQTKSDAHFISYVTHWQPAPEPPNKGEDND